MEKKFRYQRLTNITLLIKTKKEDIGKIEGIKKKREIHLGRLEFLVAGVESADPWPPALEEGTLELIVEEGQHFPFL